MTNIIGVLALFLLIISCSSSKMYRPMYITGVAVKSYTDNMHKVYSEMLSDKKYECDPELNEDIKFKEDFDDCMGPYYNIDRAEKIAIAFSSYRIAAEMYTILLLNDSATLAQRYRAWGEVIIAIYDLVSLFPDSSIHIQQLEKQFKLALVYNE